MTDHTFHVQNASELYRCWKSLPFPCLQIIGRYLSIGDAASARLVSISWAQAVPLQRVLLSLSTSSCDDSRSTCHCQHPWQAQKHQQLLQSLQQPNSCARGVRECILVVRAPQLSQLQSGKHQQQQQDNCCAPFSLVQQLAAVLPSLPNLDTLSVRTAAGPHSSSTSAAATAECGTLLHDAVLKPLAAALPSRLQSLTLNLHDWPQPEQLSRLLLQLPCLRSLGLLRCRLRVLCQLPAMPQLQHLAVSGLVAEPVPAGYSYRSQPMLPQLAGLQSLLLLNMPLDLRLQELDDIQVLGQQRQRRQQEQQQRHGNLKEQAPQEQSYIIRPGQLNEWVASSIAKQCPSLKELSSDLELGPALLPLTQLTSLHGVHPSWLRSAAAKGQTTAAGAAATEPAVAKRSTERSSAAAKPSAVVEAAAVEWQPAGEGVTSSNALRMPQELLQLRHLGVGIESAQDCLSLAQLTSLTSLAIWGSSTSSRSAPSNTSGTACALAVTAAPAQGAKAAAAAQAGAKHAPGNADVAPQQAANDRSCSMQVLLSAGLDRTLRRLVISGSWQLSSADMDEIMQRCRRLQHFCRSGNSPVGNRH